MKMVPLLAALGVLATARHQAPAAKAVELLEKLWHQGQVDLNDEALRYAKLKQWCEDTAASKTSEIREGADKEERASALLERMDSDVAAVQKDIEELVSKVSKLDDERSRAGKRRQDQASTYATSDQELQKSIRAVQRASFLLRQDESKAAASELQMAPHEAASAALAALQVEAPGFSASTILQMLMKLSDRFHGELEDLRKAETNAKQEHELTLNQLKLERETMEAALLAKRAALGEALGARKEASEDLKDLHVDMQQDEAYFQNLQVMCSLKADTFQKRRSSRQAELKALGTAVTLLKGKVSGLVQLRSGTAFAALRGGSAVHRAFQALRAGGLEALATRLAGEPLVKVRQMIMETIRRLEEASQEAAEKQSFCAAELATSRTAEAAAKEAAAELRAELDEAASEAEQLTEDQATLRRELTKLGQAIEEARQERAESNSGNAARVKEAEESQKALEAALVMLREVYQAPPSLLQVDQASAVATVAVPVEGVPETFPDADYVATPQRGVLELLEVAASSYASMASELAEEERAEAGQFQQFMEESLKDQAIKRRELTHNEDRLKNKQTALKQGKAELAKSGEKLAKVQAYLEKLQNQCKVPVLTPEERRQKRAEEVAALQQALSALEEVSD